MGSEIRLNSCNYFFEQTSLILVHKFITLSSTTGNYFDHSKLPLSFYEGSDVVRIARELLGKVLVTCFNGTVTAGRIVETEAYNGITDKASHAYGGRRTKRTEVMFGEAGRAYVYLCYGIHYLFNVVTNARDIPHAVLIRSIEPLEGADVMTERMNWKKLLRTLGKGPGNVSKALGISTVHTGSSMLSDDLYITDDGYEVSPLKMEISPRIGVDYAAEDALLPYRFVLRL
ncbi:MAG: DNA-3-methyladenine glycosylase [Chitinophagaceae bacterium]|nr:DNA-3-methyladenine glycosylase [Chitinophagaceae bacterium]